MASGTVTKATPINDSSATLLATIKIEFTPATGASYAPYGGCYYYKIGTTVHLHIGVSGLTPNTGNTVYSMPVGYRPTAPVVMAGTGGLSYTAYASASVSNTGGVSVRSVDEYATVEVIYDAFA